VEYWLDPLSRPGVILIVAPGRPTFTAETYSVAERFAERWGADVIELSAPEPPMSALAQSLLSAAREAECTS